MPRWTSRSPRQSHASAGLHERQFRSHTRVNPGTTDWIYNANTSGGTSYASMLMSFNTPTTVPAAMQCGRAVYSDAHFSGASDDSQFPNECANADPDGSHAVNEKALEFLFFDLSSCVQDNTQAPVQPPASN
jgi:hypothetical protein